MLIDKLILLQDKNFDIKGIVERLKFYPLVIYGLGGNGRPFAEWLINKGVNVLYCYDRNADIELGAVEVRHTMEKPDDNVKTIIVTNDEIYKEMVKQKQKYDGVRLIRLNHFIDNLLLIPQKV